MYGWGLWIELAVISFFALGFCKAVIVFQKYQLAHIVTNG